MCGEEHDDNIEAQLLRLSENVYRYIFHTTFSWSTREIAKLAEVAPSTVSRQVRKIESKRDVPLFDSLLSELEHSFVNQKFASSRSNERKIRLMIDERQKTKISEAKLIIEAKRVLRRMSEKGAFMLLSPDLPNAAVFRDQGKGELQRLTVTSTRVAEEFILRDWLEGVRDAKVVRYKITSRGKYALKRLIQRDRALKEEQGFADGATPFLAQHSEYVDKKISENGRAKKYRVNIAESPLSILARKKDREGRPYLSQRQVAAGERLREDFEIAQIGPRVTQNWDRFLTTATRGQFHHNGKDSIGAETSRQRLHDALKSLGDGLSDIAFRCCCHLEGLEKIEAKLGWSARSGKVVLKIALERLADFYQIPDRSKIYD